MLMEALKCAGACFAVVVGLTIFGAAIGLFVRLKRDER